MDAQMAHLLNVLNLAAMSKLLSAKFSQSAPLRGFHSISSKMAYAAKSKK